MEAMDRDSSALWTRTDPSAKSTPSWIDGKKEAGTEAPKARLAIGEREKGGESEGGVAKKAQGVFAQQLSPVGQWKAADRPTGGQIPLLQARTGKEPVKLSDGQKLPHVVSSSPPQQVTIKQAETIFSRAFPELASPSAKAFDPKLLNTIKACVNSNKKEWMAQAKKSDTGAIVIKAKEIDGKKCDITVTKTGNFFLHSATDSFGKGALMEAFYALDLKTDKIVVRAETQANKLDREGYKENLKLAKETIDAFKGCKNVLQQHAVTVFGTRQFGLISNLCEKGSLGDNQPITFKKETFIEFFKDYPEVKNQIKKMSAQELKSALTEGLSIDFNEGCKLNRVNGEAQVVNLNGEATTNPFVVLKFATHTIFHGDIDRLAKGITRPNQGENLSKFSEWLKGDVEKDFALNENSLNIKDISKQFATGLNEIHKKKYAHCDVKPDNVFVDGNNRAYVADFDQAQKILSSERLDVFGTSGYVAPEVSGGFIRNLRRRNQELSQKIEAFAEKKYVHYHQGRDVFAYGVSVGQLIRGTTGPPGSVSAFKKEGEDDVSGMSYTGDLDFDFERKLDKEPENKNSIDHLAWRCRDPNPLNRPTMKEVLKALDNPRLAIS